MTTAVLLVAGIIRNLVKEIGAWNKNNHLHRLTVPATVIAKLPHVTHHYTATTYDGTFAVESGDRMEQHLTGQEYSLLAEGDKGNLRFKGRRCLGFERT